MKKIITLPVLLLISNTLFGQISFADFESTVNSQQIIEIPLELSAVPGSDIFGIHLEFSYESEFLAFEGIETEGTISDSTSNAINAKDGEIHMSIASVHPIEAVDVLIKLNFRGEAKGDTFVTLEEFRINENDAVEAEERIDIRVFGENGNEPPMVLNLPDTLSFEVGDTLIFQVDESLISDAEDIFQDLGISYGYGFDEGDGISIHAESLDDKLIFTITSITIGYWTLLFEVRDTNGGVSNAAVVIEMLMATSNTEEIPVPHEYGLSQNYPNPFNPNTNITFTLPQASEVFLGIYNMLGQKVATLVQEKLEAGEHIVQFEATSLSSGTYIYRISADNFQQAKMMMLVK